MSDRTFTPTLSGAAPRVVEGLTWRCWQEGVGLYRWRADGIKDAVVGSDRWGSMYSAITYTGQTKHRSLHKALLEASKRINLAAKAKP